ncbi:ABC transporter permease [Neobacillus niacini]|uniref:ABC transporter permease n=1 Tax=Neobacillus niacini TaxID=86668 RepID=UPI00300378FD
MAQVNYVRNKVAFLETKTPIYASFLGITGLLVIWQIICELGWVSPMALPSPISIVAAGWEMAVSGDLLENVLTSLVRILVGFVIGVFFGIIVGLLLGFSKWFEAIITPVFFSIYPIPKIALLPLIVLWLGIGETPKITIIALGVFFPIVVNTYSGVKNVDPILIKAAVSFGASKFSVIRKAILPASLPMIFAGLKLAASTSLLLLVAAEMIASDKGVGSMILHYGNLMITSNLMAGVIVLSILGLLFNRGIQWLENKLLPWK